MANLPETPSYDQGVYQIELTDPVIGGPNGISNAPLRNLANRTAYLKQKTEQLDSQKAPKNAPEFTGGMTIHGGARFLGVEDVTAPRPAASDDSFRVSTTSWVRRYAAPKTHVGAGADAHAVATTSAAGFMSAADKQKLNGIASGAQANAVTSVAGRTGAVTLSVSDVSGALASSHAGSGGNAHALATSSTAGFMSADDKRLLNNEVVRKSHIRYSWNVNVTGGSERPISSTTGTKGVLQLPGGLKLQWIRFRMSTNTGWRSVRWYENFATVFAGCASVHASYDCSASIHPNENEARVSIKIVDNPGAVVELECYAWAIGQ